MSDINLIKDENIEEIIAKFIEREELISTGIGSGVAIPHIFLDYIDKVSVMLARSTPGIDYQAHDNCPVYLIVLFIVPKSQYHLHLKTLASIARYMNDGEIRNNIIHANSALDILNILSDPNFKNDEGKKKFKSIPSSNLNKTNLVNSI